MKILVKTAKTIERFFKNSVAFNAFDVSRKISFADHSF